MHPDTGPGQLHQRGYEILRIREFYPGEQTAHSHDFYEIQMIWNGSIHYRVENRSYYLTGGDILLVSPGELHQPELEGEQSPCERVILWLDRDFVERFRSLGIDPTACFEESPAGRSRCLRFDDEVTVRIGDLLDRCLRECDSGEFGADMMADTCMVQAMILANRLYCKNARGERRDRSGTLVSSVMAYIDSHYSEELTLDSLANRFFISKYHLSREFGRIVGISVHRYITQRRLIVARRMLGEGRPSSEVYQHCGFGDYSNFYRSFKSEFGVSPKEFVAALREDAARNPEQSQSAAEAEIG